MNIKDVKKLFRLHKEREELEKTINDLEEEIDDIKTNMNFLLVFTAGFFIFFLIFGVLFIRDGKKLIGGLLLGFDVGLIFISILDYFYDNLVEERKKIEERIEGLYKRIEKIEKELM